MKTIQELVPLIHQWAKERKIYEELTPFDERLLRISPYHDEEFSTTNWNDKRYFRDCVSLPTWEQVFAWFRKKNLVGLVSYRYRDKNNKGFSFEILDEDTDVFLYNTYEQAQEALVYKLIEIYKSE